MHPKRATSQIVLFHPEKVGFLFLSLFCSRKSKRQRETKKKMVFLKGGGKMDFAKTGLF